MQPQGTAPVNIEYYTKKIESFQEMTDCAQLQNALDQVSESLQAELDAISQQLSALAPIISLASLNFTNIDQVITFLTSFKTVILGPLVLPAVTYAAQITAMAAQITALLDAAQAAADGIPSCTITIPTIVIPTP